MSNSNEPAQAPPDPAKAPGKEPEPADVVKPPQKLKIVAGAVTGAVIGAAIGATVAALSGDD
jgi:uncharacterized membrane protein